MGNVYLCETGIFKNRLAWVMLIYAKQVFLRIDLHG